MGVMAARDISGLPADEQERITRKRDRAKKRAAAYRKRHPERAAESQRKWRDDNPGVTTQIHKLWRRNNRSADVAHHLRIRIADAVRAVRNGGHRAGSAVRDLGCTIPELIEHLEDKFTPGMTWDNYGDWHIDHRIPLALYDLTDREQFLTACHFTNLQPKWAGDNLAKGTKLEPPSIW